MNLQLSDKLALVTGSTAGIGRAICEALLREGASVIVNGRSQASVDHAVARLRSDFGNHVLSFAGDLSTAAAAQDLAERFPGVEILAPGATVSSWDEAPQLGTDHFHLQ